MKKLFVCVAMLAPVVAIAQQPAPAPAPAAAPAAAAPAPAATTAAAVDPTTVILQIGEEKLTAADFDQIVEGLPDQVKAMIRTPAGKRRLAESIVELKLLAQEARRRGLDKEPGVAATVRLQVDQALAQAMAENASKATDEAALKADYDKNKDQYDQVKARHILIRTPDSDMPQNPLKKQLTAEEAKAKADDIKKRVTEKKEDFAAIAKAESDDTGSGQRGGDLGYFTKGMMVGPFEEAAFALKPGEVSEPVKSQFGWHVIQAEDRRPSTFEEVKARMTQQQGGKQLQDLMKKLKETQPVKLNEDYFGPAGAPGLPAGHP